MKNNSDYTIFRDTARLLLTQPQVLGLRVSREHYLWLKDQIEMLEQELAAVQCTVVAIIGGTVEGRPTSTVNYLQRLRELVDFEASTPNVPSGNAMTIEQIVEDMNRQIASAPIATPCAGERVEDCGYSRTGWAVVRADGQCTCKPALPPEPPESTP